MNTNDRHSHLHRIHSDEAIAERLDGTHSHSDTGDVVLGAVDGTITTFAIISGIAGTQLEQGVLVAFVLGLANVVADGFSMGASNYLKARSDQQTFEQYRKMEEFHIEEVPHYEREEIRQIYIRKGFSGELLEQIVSTISANKKLWVDTMLAEEWGLSLTPVAPLRSALLTFGAFLFAGSIPLLPLLLGYVTTIEAQQMFLLSACVTALVFFVTGALRGKVTGVSWIQSAFETLFVGGVAAAIAYFVGNVFGGLML